MAEIFERNYRCYGYRRIHAALSRQSLKISEKVVRRLMKQECLRHRAQTPSVQLVHG